MSHFMHLVRIQCDHTCSSRERNLEKEDKNDTWHCVEHCSGMLTRSFKLPKNAKVDQVNASMENGVLIVTLPKAEVK
ncbi:Class I heat shock protein, partial [Mucuna pruriens]